MKRILCVFLLVVPSVVLADWKHNPFTGSPDYYEKSTTVTDNLPGGSTSYVQANGNLQAGATFYVSSGTVAQEFHVSSKSPLDSIFPQFQDLSVTASNSSMGLGPQISSNRGLKIIANNLYGNAPSIEMPAGAQGGLGSGYLMFTTSGSTVGGVIYQYDGQILWKSGSSSFYGIRQSTAASVSTYAISLPARGGNANELLASVGTSTLTWTRDLSLLSVAASTVTASSVTIQNITINGTCTGAGCGAPPQTLAQLKAYTPSRTGEQFFCSDCSVPMVCVSTGTALYSLKAVTPPQTDWTVYTPTGAWTTNVTYTGKWRRNGPDLFIYGLISLTGATDAGNVTFSLPPGFSIDTALISTTTVTRNDFGSGKLRINSGGSTYLTSVYAPTVTVLSLMNMNATSSNGLPQIIISNTTPFTLAANDTLQISARNIPIVGWSAVQCQ